MGQLSIENVLGQLSSDKQKERTDGLTGLLMFKCMNFTQKSLY